MCKSLQTDTASLKKKKVYQSAPARILSVIAIKTIKKIKIKSNLFNSWKSCSKRKKSSFTIWKALKIPLWHNRIQVSF